MPARWICGAGRVLEHLQTDEAAEARRHSSFALRVLAAMADQSEDEATRRYAQQSLERSLVSLRSLLAQPELDDALRLEALMTLHSFWDA
jgi:hypothetical protein